MRNLQSSSKQSSRKIMNLLEKNRVYVATENVCFKLLIINRFIYGQLAKYIK